MLLNIKYLLIIFILVFSILIQGCGFKPRSPNDLAPPLHTLYIDTPNPYSPFIIQLKRTLKALDVKLVTNPKYATIGLRIPELNYIQHHPDLLTMVVAVRYFVSLEFKASIYDIATDKTIIAKNFSVNRFVLLNANQTLVPSMLPLASRELTDEGVDMLYYWISSQSVYHILRKPYYANELQAATHGAQKKVGPDLSDHGRCSSAN